MKFAQRLVWIACMLGIAPLTAQAVALTSTTVDVQGKATQYHASGLDTRKPGQPALVIIAGFGSSLEKWSPLLAKLDPQLPVLAYDRPGAGRSAALDGLLTLERASTHLRELLKVTGISPPYLFVAHSWGGVIALDYATRFPGEVVGNVSLDPTNVLFTAVRDEQLLRKLGATDAEILALRAESIATEPAMLAQMPAGLRSEMEVILLTANRPSVDWVPAQPRIPTSILLAGRFDSSGPEGVQPPVDLETYFRAEREIALRDFQARLQGIPGTSVRVLDEAGHNLHREAPDIVALEIARVLSLAWARGETPRPAKEADAGKRPD